MGDNAVLSPASGRILEIASSIDDPGVPGTALRLSIFLSLWDDHTTRSPIDGKIESIVYTPGLFGVALFKKNLKKNENNLVWIRGGAHRLAIRQIAGRIAKRIVFDFREGDDVSQGQALGEIKWGSCVQIYLSSGWRTSLRVGQKVVTGKTPL
jgi:phosphatidylserine decarboxylase